jgi:predicted O-methyltransferase YrrM
LHQIIAYIKFLLKSTNQHGVHSPFVYSLLTECLYKKDKKYRFAKLVAFRKSLLNDSRVIRVTDFGAGSRVFKSNDRKVSSIAKNAGISIKRAKLLNKLTSYLNCKNALELGTSLGLSSAAMAIDNPVYLITIEGCPETASIAQLKFDEFTLNNIQLKIGDFDEQLDRLTPSNMDLIYFDGNHQKEPTIKYFHKLLPLAHNDSVFIFDDIHWSSEMEEAWEEIKAHPKVQVSIDSFFWGMIFFRKEQEKEHFTLRL